MSNEAARARLDAKAPKTDLRLLPLRKPLLPSPYGSAQPCPGSQTWTFDRDENDRLLVRCFGQLRNLGDTSITVRICADGDALVSPVESENGPPEPRSKIATWRLQPSKAADFLIEADYSIREWAEGWESRAIQHPPTPSMLVYIEVDDGEDNGVIDWWAVLLSGCPVAPVEGNRAEWRLRSEDEHFNVFVTNESRQRHRDYYLSRRARLTVPELSSQLVTNDSIEGLRRVAHVELYGEPAAGLARNLAS